MSCKYFLKEICISALILLSLFENSSSQESLFTGELLITNGSSRGINVKIYPISCVFNGIDVTNGPHLQYNLSAVNVRESFPIFYHFINGRNTQYESFPISSNSDSEINHDMDSYLGSTDATVGYGKYLIKISWYEGFDYKFDTCTVEWDAAYPYQNALPPNNIWTKDLHINFYDDNSNPRVYFKWSDGTREYPISYVNKQIVAWDQQYYFNTQTNDSTRRLRSKDYGNFVYDNAFGNGYTFFPQDSRKDCAEDENQEFSDTRSGYITLNVVVSKNITTRDTLLDNPTNVVVTRNAMLKIAQNTTLNMITPDIPTAGYTNLLVQDTAYLVLYNGSKIIVDVPNRITLQNNSRVTLFANSEIQIKPGGLFCNEGGTVRGPGRIRYTGGTHIPPCRPDSKVITFEDSSKMMLDSNAILEIPDSTTLKFKGNQTKFIMTPTSKLKMGVNSKLVFENGARMLSNHSTIISKDTTKLWDGIYSSDLSLDTITNCKIINAKNGINLLNKTHETVDHSVLITDCQFINKTSSYINTAIYAYNSDRILVRNNDIYGQSTGGFYCGVNFEFCVPYELVIVDNEFEDCYIGISDIQSSSYIARNVLEGNAGYGYGITLDNASGTLKHNLINNFDASIVSYLSSPYMYGNTLQDAATMLLSLESYSIPVMYPSVTAFTYWYGGNNTLSLSETSVGISMYADSYPLINDGYNKFYLNDADYYIEGEIPSEFNDTFEVKNNNWNSSVSAGNFNIGGIVIYNPTEDGSSGSRAYNTIQTFEIGFGLYDTIYVNMEGDNVNTDAFIAAHTAEHSRNFEDAIEYYKDLVSVNDGNLSRISIQRIYGCYEKTNFFGNGVSTAKNYFDELRSNSGYDSISRAIATDMFLKTKFRNSELTSVENAYDQMYQSNQNNGIGVHALINKTIVEDLTGDSTDNSTISNSFSNLEKHKNSIFNILSSKNNTIPFAANSVFVSGYELKQNYPNPFNPETIISYNIPVSGNVTLKIYDILGREIQTLINEFKNSGNHEIIFDASNLTSGMYFYRLTANGFTESKRMMLVK